MRGIAEGRLRSRPDPDLGFLRTPKEVLNNLPNRLDLRLRQLGVDRQTEAFAGGFLGDREIAGLVTEGGEALLQMEGQRIVQTAADAIGIEVSFQPIAPPTAPHVEMPCALGII